VPCRDPAVPRGLLRRAGRPGVLLPVAVAPAFHLFPRGLCGDRWGMEHCAQETAFPQVNDLREWSG
jgi:hypothetical protein